MILMKFFKDFSSKVNFAHFKSEIGIFGLKLDLNGKSNAIFVISDFE